jgi:hypothetical protein
MFYPPPYIVRTVGTHSTCPNEQSTSLNPAVVPPDLAPEIKGPRALERFVVRNRPTDNHKVSWQMTTTGIRDPLSCLTTPGICSRT